MLNEEIAKRLEEVAQLLNEQDANYYRQEAYRRAAKTIRFLKKSAAEIFQEKGIDGLKEIPGIGETLARFIVQLITLGKLPMLDRLRGATDPVHLLSTIPGIGKITARRIHSDLGIESLEELEFAAADGRLANIEGIGKKRLTGIRESLDARLRRVRREQTLTQEEVPVAEILDVDREYRNKAQQGLLPKIAPHRFNPRREAWLPILHTQRRNRNYTALFSNTAHAHELQKTRDWVVIYMETDHHERQQTVITSTYGNLKGKRIVRGRESECAEYYGAWKTAV